MMDASTISAIQNVDKYGKLAIPERAIFDVSAITPEYITPDGERIKMEDKRVWVKTDTPDVYLGVHSTRYGAKPYYNHLNDVNDIIIDNIDALNDGSLDNISVSRRVFENGMKIQSDIKFHNRKIYPMGKSGEAVTLCLKMFDSFNGAWSMQDLISMWMKICANGMFGHKQVLRAYNKHTVSKSIEKQREYLTADKIQLALENFSEDEEKFAQMATTQVTDADAEHLFKRTIARNKANKLNVNAYSENVLSDLNNIYVGYVNIYGRTLWTIYNTATDWASHPEKSTVSRGKSYNVVRSRGNEVNSMINSELWSNIGHKRLVTAN